MRLQLIIRGRRFNLYAIDLSDSPNISNHNTTGEFKMAVSSNGDARAEIESGYLDETLSELARDPEFVAERVALTLAEDILKVMRDNKVSKSELARRMGVSRAYVSQMLDAPPNLTLLTISKVSLALELEPNLRLLRDAKSPEFTKPMTESVATA